MIIDLPAILSTDERHRFWLSRELDPLGIDETEPKLVVFVMLNPSTADAQADDPTIRRCIRFAKREHGTRLGVLNLWSLRATDPAELFAWDHTAEPEALWDNQRAFSSALTAADLVVAAWGAHVAKVAAPRPSLGFARELVCLGRTKDGEPRHPLYVAGDTELQPWAAA